MATHLTMRGTALARAALIAQESAQVRLGRDADRTLAVAAALRAWTSGDQHVAGLDGLRPPLPLRVADYLLARIRSGEADPTVALAGALERLGVTPTRIELCGPDEITMILVRDVDDAMRTVANLADANRRADDPDEGRWMTVEAFDDRWSAGTWRVLVGTERRTGRGR